MSSLIIHPNSDIDIKFLVELLERMHIPVTILSDEQKEDMGLLMAMHESENDEYVPEEDIMKILKQDGSSL